MFKGSTATEGRRKQTNTVRKWRQLRGEEGEGSKGYMRKKLFMVQVRYRKKKRGKQ